MNRLARKILFLLTIVCFAVFATNIMFVLHIDCEHDNDEHTHSQKDSSPDSSQCPVCQKLLTSVTSLHIEQQIIFVDTHAAQHEVPFRQNVNLSGFYPEAISPRGPPV